MKRLVFLSGLLIAGFSFGQEAPVELPNLDLLAWGASVLVFGKALQFLTEFIKTRLEHQLAKLPNFIIHVVNFALGLGLSYAIYAQGWLTDATFAGYGPPLNWILFGAVASAVAGGWYDLLKNPRIPTSTEASPTDATIPPPRRF